MCIHLMDGALGRSEGFVQGASMTMPALAVGLIALNKYNSMKKGEGGSITLTRFIEYATATALFLTSGPAVILLNKTIIKEHHFRFPMVLASLGNLLLMLLSRAAVKLGICELDTQTMEWGKYVKVVLLMNLFNFGTQSLGMSTYMFISVPTIQFLKSFTVVMVMVFATIFLKEKASARLVISIVVIAVGTAWSTVFDQGSGTEVHQGTRLLTQLTGISMSLVASSMEAAKMVCSQLLMTKLSVFDGVYWSSPAFMIFACAFISVFELPRLLAFQYTPQLCGYLMLNAVLTSLTVLSNFWFVKLVGALVTKVVTQARTVGLVLASVLFFRESCTPMQYVGYSISLIGIGLFDEAKQRLNAEKEAAKVASLPKIEEQEETERLQGEEEESSPKNDRV